MDVQVDSRVEPAGADGQVGVVEVRGDLDFASAPRVREALLAHAAGGRTTVVADLSAVPFLDSTGLGVLVAVLKRLRSMDGDLHVVLGNQRTRSVFELTGLTAAFALHDDPASALAAASGE